MATLAQIRNAIDTKLSPLWDKIKQRQLQYAANHGGRYWQGLSTHSIVPLEGTEAPPDRILDRPHYQNEGWEFIGDIPATLPMSIRCDQYDGPFGRGFCCTVTVEVLGEKYERAAQQGPETWRAFGWRKVIENESL